MPVDAFGRQAMSLRELKEALDYMVLVNPEILDQPVWVDSMPVYKPVKRVVLTHDRRLILEVHHV